MSRDDHSHGQPRPTAPMHGRTLGEIGDRVKIIQWAVGPSGFDDNKTVPPGTEGTILSTDDLGGRFVAWDNGTRLSLLLNDDRWEVVS